MPRSREPNPLRVVKGAKARPRPESEPLDDGPPAWMPAEGCQEWERVVAAAGPGHLQVLDRAALAAYCSTWATWCAAAADVAERGPLVPGRSSADEADGRLVKNPSLQITRDAGAALRGWVRELGFSPDARGRVDMGAATERRPTARLLTGGP